MKQINPKHLAANWLMFFSRNVFLKPILLFLPVIIIHNNLSAQFTHKTIKFSDVKVEDFAPQVYSIDSSASAIYLFDAGYTKFVPNQDGYFDVQFTHYCRIRLLKKGSFDDAAKVEFPLITTLRYQEKLINFEAVTYNLKDEKVDLTLADKTNLFQDKVVKTKHADFSLYKFTFPQIEEGSIIEYEYTVQYPGKRNIQSWSFQSEYPCLHSEYEITQPAYFSYIITKRGAPTFDVDSTINVKANYGAIDDEGKPYSMSDILKTATPAISHLWIMKNVPALKKEPFVSAYSNYLFGIDFDLYAVQYPGRNVGNYIANWKNEMTVLSYHPDFGGELYENTGWEKSVLRNIISTSASKIEQARKIYEYVRDNFYCNDDKGIYLTQYLQDVSETKKGSMADINLLLTDLYLKAGLTSMPVILSTKENGIAPQKFPTLDDFNYVITLLKIDGQDFLLDASDKNLSFNHLSASCYNGYAHIVDTAASVILLSADSITEIKLTNVAIYNQSNSLGGSFNSYPGFVESLDLRNKYNNEKPSDYFNDIKNDYTIPVEITNTLIDSLQNPDSRLNIKYNMKFDIGDDIIYFNPLLSEAYKENPFKSDTRLYPVEMPYCKNEVYILNMEIPKGYVVDELPKSVRVKLNEDDGLFEYIIANTGTNIQLKCTLKLNKANFDPNDYESLRNFFAFVVKKESEQIVFKKE